MSGILRKPKQICAGIGCLLKKRQPSFSTRLPLPIPIRIILAKRREKLLLVIHRRNEYSFYRTRSENIVLESLAHERQHRGSVNNMKKASAKKNNNDLRPEYDLSKLKGGVRGKYYRQATAGTNLVLIEPELTEVFPDTKSVNRALRLLVNTAALAAGKTRNRGKNRHRKVS
jgi:hypothetical protein